MIMRNMAWAAGVVLFTGIAMAQTTTAITGEVIGEDGKPLKDAVIKIVRTDIKGNYPCKTKKKGDYYYGGLPLGMYNITVEVDGVAKDSVNGVKTSPGEPRVINFNLAEVKKKRDALNQAASTGQLTADQAKQLTAEQRAQLEEHRKQREAQMAKDRALNDAFNAGMQAYEAKQYDVAVESFKKAAEVNTAPANQHVIMARLADAATELSASKTGAERDAMLTQAQEAWTKAIELAPTNAGYHNNFAKTLARAGKLQEAQAELQKAIELDPPNAGMYYYNLGVSMLNANQNAGACANFKKAIEVQPNYAEAYFRLGNCLVADAKLTPDGKMIPPDGAKEAFDKYLALAPNGPNADAAKAMLGAFASQVQTTYTNPNAPPPTPKKATKKK